MQIKEIKPAISLKNRSVSMLELLVVLSILGILALGVVPFTMVQVQSIKEEELRENVKKIRDAIQAYRTESRRRYLLLCRDWEGVVDCANLTSITTHIPPWQFNPQLNPGESILNVLAIGTTTFLPASVTTNWQAYASGTQVRPMFTNRKLPVDPFTGLASWTYFFFPANSSYVYDIAPSRPENEADWKGVGPVRSLGGTHYADF